MKSFLVVMLVFASFGCAHSLRAPLTGLVYNDSAAGLLASSNQTGNREGIACAKSILGLVSTGDASIETARRNGGVTLIATADETFEEVLGVYAKHCTIVRGR